MPQELIGRSPMFGMLISGLNDLLVEIPVSISDQMSGDSEFMKLKPHPMDTQTLIRMKTQLEDMHRWYINEAKVKFREES